jgi:hypothetical protein
MPLFRNIQPYQTFYLKTNLGPVTFVKLGDKAIVVSSNHWYYKEGSLLEMGNNRQFLIKRD